MLHQYLTNPIPYSRKLSRVKTFANSMKLSISRIKLSRIAEATTRVCTKPTRGVDLESARRDDQEREQRLGFGMEGLATSTEP